MDGFVEWPFEGDPKYLIGQNIVFMVKSVGVTGNLQVYEKRSKASVKQRK